MIPDHTDERTDGVTCAQWLVRINAQRDAVAVATVARGRRWRKLMLASGQLSGSTANKLRRELK